MDHALLQNIVTTLLTHLELPFDGVRVHEDGDITRVDIDSAQASRLIGWHGETLNALQNLVKSIMRTQGKLERAPFLVLDVDGYRRIQEDKVRKVAEQKADFVRRTGNRVALAPMSPYFRRIVHLHVAAHPDMQDLMTESMGEGEYRQIILRLKDESSREASSGEELSPVMDEDGDGLENLDV